MISVWKAQVVMFEFFFFVFFFALSQPSTNENLMVTLGGLVIYVKLHCSWNYLTVFVLYLQS